MQSRSVICASILLLGLVAFANGGAVCGGSWPEYSVTTGTVRTDTSQAGFVYYNVPLPATLAATVFVEVKETSTPTNKLQIFTQQNACGNTTSYQRKSVNAVNGCTTAVYIANGGSGGQSIWIGVYSTQASISYTIRIFSQLNTVAVPITAGIKYNVLTGLLYEYVYFQYTATNGVSANMDATNSSAAISIYGATGGSLPTTSSYDVTFSATAGATNYNNQTGCGGFFGPVIYMVGISVGVITDVNMIRNFYVYDNPQGSSVMTSLTNSTAVTVSSAASAYNYFIVPTTTTGVVYHIVVTETTYTGGVTVYGEGSGCASGNYYISSSANTAGKYILSLYLSSLSTMFAVYSTTATSYSVQVVVGGVLPLTNGAFVNGYYSSSYVYGYYSIAPSNTQVTVTLTGYYSELYMKEGSVATSSNYDVFDSYYYTYNSRNSSISNCGNPLGTIYITPTTIYSYSFTFRVSDETTNQAPTTVTEGVSVSDAVSSGYKAYQFATSPGAIVKLQAYLSGGSGYIGMNSICPYLASSYDWSYTLTQSTTSDIYIVADSSYIYFKMYGSSSQYLMSITTVSGDSIPMSEGVTYTAFSYNTSSIVFSYDVSTPTSVSYSLSGNSYYYWSNYFKVGSVPTSSSYDYSVYGSSYFTLSGCTLGTSTYGKWYGLFTYTGITYMAMTLSVSNSTSGVVSALSSGTEVSGPVTSDSYDYFAYPAPSTDKVIKVSLQSVYAYYNTLYIYRGSNCASSSYYTWYGSGDANGYIEAVMLVTAGTKTSISVYKSVGYSYTLNLTEYDNTGISLNDEKPREGPLAGYDSTGYNYALQYFYVDVVNGAFVLSIKGYNTYFYMKQGSLPTSSSYDYSGYGYYSSSYNNFTYSPCYYPSTSFSGRWYIAIYGYSSSSSSYWYGVQAFTSGVPVSCSTTGVITGASGTSASTTGVVVPTCNSTKASDCYDAWLTCTSNGVQTNETYCACTANYGQCLYNAYCRNDTDSGWSFFKSVCTSKPCSASQCTPTSPLPSAGYVVAPPSYFVLVVFAVLVFLSTSTTEFFFLRS